MDKLGQSSQGTQEAVPKNWMEFLWRASKGNRLAMFKMAPQLLKMVRDFKDPKVAKQYAANLQAMTKQVAQPIQQGIQGTVSNMAKQYAPWLIGAFGAPMLMQGLGMMHRGYQQNQMINQLQQMNKHMTAMYRRMNQAPGKMPAQMSAQPQMNLANLYQGRHRLASPMPQHRPGLVPGLITNALKNRRGSTSLATIKPKIV